MTIWLSLTGQTVIIIIGVKESGESHAKVMFHWNAWRNFMQLVWKNGIDKAFSLCIAVVQVMLILPDNEYYIIRIQNMWYRY